MVQILRIYKNTEFAVINVIVMGVMDGKAGRKKARGPLRAPPLASHINITVGH